MSRFFYQKYSIVYLAMLIYVMSSFFFSFSLNQIVKSNKPAVVTEQLTNDSLDHNVQQLQKKSPFKLFLVGIFFMTLFCVGLILNILLFMSFFANKEHLNLSVGDSVLNIENADFFRGIILFLFLHTVFFDIQKMISGGEGAIIRSIFLVLNTLGIYSVMMVFFYRILRHKNENLRACFGLSLKNIKQRILIGIAGYVGFVPYFIVLVLVTLSLFKLMGLPLKAHPIIGYFKKETSSFITIYLTVFAMFIAPIVEELLFRGIIFKLFKRYFSVSLSVVLTSLLFAVLHFNLSQFIPIVGMGIMLNLLYIKTNSLIPAITFHVVNNSVALVLTHLIVR